MGDVVSLNKFRKARAKDSARQKASENRIRHGQTKAQKQERAAQDQQDTKHIDGHSLDSTDKPED